MITFPFAIPESDSSGQYFSLTFFTILSIVKLFDECCYSQNKIGWIGGLIRVVDMSLCLSPLLQAHNCRETEFTMLWYGCFLCLPQGSWLSSWVLNALDGRRAWHCASSCCPCLSCPCMPASTGEFGSPCGPISYVNGDIIFFFFLSLCFHVHTGQPSPLSSSSPEPRLLQDSRWPLCTHPRYVNALPFLGCYFPSWILYAWPSLPFSFQIGVSNS